MGMPECGMWGLKMSVLVGNLHSLRSFRMTYWEVRGEWNPPWRGQAPPYGGNGGIESRPTLLEIGKT